MAKKTFKRPMFRIHLYEQKGNDFGGSISLTNEEHKIKKNLTRQFNSLEKIPRAMRKLLKKAKKALAVVGSADGVPPKRKKFTMSAEARARIAKAQKARWKALKSKSGAA